jgi:hypothetical protein
MEKSCELADHCPVRKRRALTARMMKNPKRKGELAELIFVLTAASHGLLVSKPYGDSAPFDFLVQTGNRAQRVQVKAAFTRSRSGYYFHVGTGSKHIYYTENDIDILAAYVAPEDIWYILPVQSIHRTTSIVVSPGSSSSHRGAKYESYREGWHLLTGTARETP